MLIQATQLRPGMILEYNNGLWRVMAISHITPGNWRGMVQTKLRNVKTGTQTENRFRSEDRVERIILSQVEMEFLYQEGDDFHFMNTETYDQVTLPVDIIGNQTAYLQPEMKVMLSVHEGVPVSIELPQKATLEVMETEPSVKGQTAASSYKPAVLSNGVRTMVPPFVGPGTKIVVMTADGSYVERAKD